MKHNTYNTLNAYQCSNTPITSKNIKKNYKTHKLRKKKYNVHLIHVTQILSIQHNIKHKTQQMKCLLMSARNFDIYFCNLESCVRQFREIPSYNSHKSNIIEL